MKTVNIDIMNHFVSFRIGQKASDHHPMLDDSNPSDIWFHLENRPSCHIIASIPNNISRETVKKIIRHGIRLSKEHATLKEKSVNVIYRRVRNVFKGTIEGQVILDV